MLSFLPVFDLSGYPGRILLTHGLFDFSSWGGFGVQMLLVSRHRSGLPEVAVLPRIVVWFSEKPIEVRLFIPSVAFDVW